MSSLRLPQLPPVTVSESNGVRFLHLGSIWVQGAMKIAKPHRVQLDYIQRMLASLLWLPSETLGQGRAVQLGLGAGAITRFTRNQLRMPTTVVELNPQVIDACRAWFQLPKEDWLLQLVCSDAGRWLSEEAQPRSTRLLHVDLYDEEAAAPVLDTPEFYAACRELLEDGGLMSVNLFGRRSSYSQSAARIAAAFGPRQVWSMQPTREGNTAVIAGRGVELPPREELVRRAATIDHLYPECALQARKWPRMVRAHASA